MIDYARMKAEIVPDAALVAYRKYNGNQRTAEAARDYDALAKMQAWGAFIECQYPVSETKDSDPYMQGYHGFRNNTNTNPFEIGSSNWRVWNTGFQTAQAES